MMTLFERSVSGGEGERTNAGDGWKEYGSTLLRAGERKGTGGAWVEDKVSPP
jgi:hypothetical protein